MRLLVFSNLWPSSAAPGLGGFVRDRVERLSAHMGFEYEVMHPVALYPWHPGQSHHARMSRLPSSEVYQGVRCHYPRYFHVPRFGLARQAQRMTRGSRRCFLECVERFRPDLVDAHYLYPDACAAVDLSAEVNLPLLATARGSDVNVLGDVEVVRAQYRKQLPRVSQLMAVSTALARQVESVAALPADSVLPMRSGVDLERFSVGRDAPAMRVLCLARLHPVKRIDLLIRSFAQVVSSARLEIIGGGPELDRLRKLGAELGLGTRLHFHGELGRDAVAQELQKGGVFALASRHEGWPNALLEALASGLYAVTSDAGGMPEILGPSAGAAGTCLPVSAGAEAWAEALQRALGDLERQGRQAGMAARARAEALSWNETLAALTRVIEAAVTA